MAQPTPAARFPLLQTILIQKDLPLRAIYTNRDFAEVFGVSVRTVQDWIREGKLLPRNLPGRGRFLPEDIEAFLQASLKKPRANREG